MKGLELELGIYSPSDCRHSFRDFHLEPNYPFQEIREIQNDASKAYSQRNEHLKSFNDELHGWVDGRRESESVICLREKQRLMGTLGFITEELYTLPQVKVVTCLLIRRQFYRKISGRSLGILLDSLTNLIEFRREGWLDVDAQEQLGFDRGTLNIYRKRGI